MLTNEEWCGLEELCHLLHPFARASVFMSGDQYPTLGMMYPIIRHLFKILDQIRDQLVHPSVIETHQSLYSSMAS